MNLRIGHVRGQEISVITNRAQKFEEIWVARVTGSAEIVMLDPVEEFGECRYPASAFALEEHEFRDVLKWHTQDMRADERSKAVETERDKVEAQQAQIASV